VASFVPGLSVVTGGLDAAIYAGEGNYVEAGIAAASMIPGGKVVTTVGKVAKGAVGMMKEAKIASNVVQKGGMGAKDAKVAAATKAKEVMGKLAALHEPDMVAGGWAHPDPKGMGRSDV
jgi:Novel toxin 15